MTDSHSGHLVKMANEITRNLSVGDTEAQAAARVADHLRRFWTRDMQQQLQAYAASGGSGLLPVTQLALARLRDEGAA
jgi:formate dehydrogenase subunit delta